MRYMVEILSRTYQLIEKDGVCAGMNMTYELLDIIEVEVPKSRRAFVDDWYYDRYIRITAIQQYQQKVGGDIPFVIGDLVEI